MNTDLILTNAILIAMIMDPFGNLPFFVSLLKHANNRRYLRIVVRESLIALLVMVLALFAGRWWLQAMGITPNELKISGGIILFLIGLKMVFSSFSAAPPGETPKAGPEPFIVPLAIPLICGPGAIAFLITQFGNAAAAEYSAVLAAIVLAWLFQLAVLLTGRLVARALGEKVLDALESLMGLMLTAVAVGLFLSGLNALYHIGQ